MKSCVASTAATRAAAVASPRAPDEGIWLDNGHGRSVFTRAGCLRLSTVGDAYRCQCVTAVCDLDAWAVENELYDQLEKDADTVMEFYFNALVSDSVGPQTGAVTMYGYVLLRTDLNARDKSVFPKCRVALRGWQREMPGKARDPVDLDMIWLIGEGFLDDGEVDCAAALALQADAYLRPSEAVGLSSSSVVFATAGQACRGALADAVALSIAPFEEGVPAKTGAFDDTVLLGTFGNRSWVREVARGAFREGPLFPGLDLTRYERGFQRITRRLGITKLGITPHVVRHSAPSTDLLNEAISLPELKKRGRWASDRSVNRYGKAGRLLIAMRKVPDDIALRSAEARLSFPGRLLAALRSR